jgi:hypothetical protein
MDETQRQALEAKMLRSEVRPETRAIFSTIFNGHVIYTIVNEDTEKAIGRNMDDVILFCERHHDRCLYRRV